MKLIRKYTLFQRAIIEMSIDEYRAYKLGRFYGVVSGIVIGVGLSIGIMVLIKIFGL